MAHAEVLSVMGRLQMDPAFRRAFLRDPAEALQPLDLSPAERLALAGLDRTSVIRVGRMADAHRIIRIQEHLSWVDLALRPDLRALLASYLEGVPPRLLNRDEALAFCEHVEVTAPDEPPYLSELVRFERLRISLAWGRGGVRSGGVSFEYPLDRVLARLGDPGWPVVSAAPSQVELRKVPALPAVTIRW
jgi:hypothetical protein